MWSQYYQASLSQLLRKSILGLCSENVPFEDKLEIDGIICISTATDEKQIVVKVHEVVESLREKTSEVSLIPSSECSNKSCSTEPEDEEIFTIESQDGGPRSMDGYQSDSLDGSQCEISVAVENGTSVEYTVTAPAGFNQDADTSEEDRETAASPSSRLPCRDIFPLRRVHHSIERHREINSDREQEDSGVLASHMGEFLCRHCGSRFNSFSSLNAHNYDVHCRFTCRQCLNTFSMMCNLKRHERLHMGRKQYTCNQCGKGFSRNSDLRIHSLKLHRHPGLTSRQQKHYHEIQSHQENTHPGKRAKSAALGDILSKLALKQLQNLKERERRMDDDDGTMPHKSHVQSDEHKWIHEEKIEPDENTMDLSKQNLETGHNKEDKELSSNEGNLSIIPTPQLTPVFSRSILKPSVQVNSLPKESTNIIHIYPTGNSSSGGHLEEAPVAKKIQCDALTSAEPNGMDRGHYDASTVHGFTFGRIVFPSQSSIKSEQAEERSCPEVEVGLANLPFLTYAGRKQSISETQKASQQLEVAEEPPEKSERVCLSPTNLARSRSSSPLRTRTPPLGPRTHKDDHPDSPALIALDRRYWCHLCKTQWENFGSYEQHHVSQHLRYPCQFCDQTFSNKNNRSRHIRSHTGQKEHICPDCGKSFSRSDTLKEHQIIHTDGYLGDQCDYCHVVIKKKAELLGHIKKCSQKQRGRLSASASPSSYSD